MIDIIARAKAAIKSSSKVQLARASYDLYWHAIGTTPEVKAECADLKAQVRSRLAQLNKRGTINS